MTENIKKYSELTENEILQLLNLIKKGGEVDNEKLPLRFSKSELIAFNEISGEIVAVATIKKPLKSYKINVFEKSKSNLLFNDYNYELGYVMVDENYRKDKLASKLCYKIIEHYKSEKVFATTKVENFGMKKILLKNNFNEIGNQFLNKDKSAFLTLYTNN